jgi:D-lactate dehydrogenase (cytochrome)
MDLVDLFIGAEGTLGITTAVTFRTATKPAANLMAMVAVAAEARALALVARLREASEATWRTGDPCGIDAIAIESVDARSIALLREDGADVRAGVTLPADAQAVLFVELEPGRPLTDEDAWRQVEGALADEGPDGPVTRLCRLLSEHGLLEATELALPGQAARRERFRQLREAVPDAVNRRVARAKADDARISKTAADIVVPFSRFEDLMAACRQAFVSRGLDYAVWGHVSDGNVHPNAIPRSFDDVLLGREAVMAIGEAAIALGGAPLAEHGVGRNPIKKALLRRLHGDEGIASMQAVKRAIDPRGLLAPGVLL